MSLIFPLVTQCRSLILIISGLACYCSKLFSYSVRLFTFYPSSMPFLDVGDLQNHKCPLLIVGVFKIVEPHSISKAWVWLGVKRKRRKNSNQNPHIMNLPWSHAWKNSLPQRPKESSTSPPRWTQWRRALSLAAPLLQSGPHAPSMAFGMRVQTLLTSHVLPLTCLINSVVFFIEKQKKRKKRHPDTLCGVVSPSRSDDCEGVMHMQHCTM